MSKAHTVQVIDKDNKDVLDDLTVIHHPPDALSEKGAVEGDTKPHRPPLQELDDLGKDQPTKPHRPNTYQAADEITPG